MTSGNIVNEAMFLIEKMAALSSTEGVSQDTKDVANRHMQDLLNGPIKAAVTELKAASSGIVTLS